MADTLRNPKGTTDEYGEHARLKRRIITTITDAFETFGFEYLETPALEYTDTLTSKFSGGEEIIKEIFTLTDRGKRSLALRYDHTVPLARFIATHPEIAQPYKRYTVGQIFRDGPIKTGRRRVFTQADADIVGIRSVHAELELLELARHVFGELGIDARIVINHRALLEALICASGISIEHTETVMLSLDKLAKIGEDGVRADLEDKGIPQAATLMQAASAARSMGPGELASYSEHADLDEKTKERARSALEDIEFLISHTQVEFDITLARGLNYYSGVVFEAFAQDSTFTSSIAAGGRYENILTAWTGKQTAASGISFGVDAILASGSLEAGREQPRIFIIPIKRFDAAYELARVLRNERIRCSVDVLERSITKNLRYASSYDYAYALIVGDEEAESGTYTLRNLETGVEQKVSAPELIRMFTAQTM